MLSGTKDTKKALSGITKLLRLKAVEDVTQLNWPEGNLMPAKPSSKVGTSKNHRDWSMQSGYKVRMDDDPSI